MRECLLCSPEAPHVQAARLLGPERRGDVRIPRRSPQLPVCPQVSFMGRVDVSATSGQFYGSKLAKQIFTLLLFKKHAVIII